MPSCMHHGISSSLAGIGNAELPVKASRPSSVFDHPPPPGKGGPAIHTFSEISAGSAAEAARMGRVAPSESRISWRRMAMTIMGI